MHTTCCLLLLLLTSLHYEAKDVGSCEKKGTHCYSPDAHWQFDGTCVVLKNVHRCHVPDTREFKFELRISIRLLRRSPTSTARPLDKLWIRGSGPGLSWDKPIRLVKSAKGLGLWVTEIGYKYDSRSTLCKVNIHCLFSQRAVEFRVYQDEAGKYDMVGPNLYIKLPVTKSMFGHKNFILQAVDVLPWFGGTAITVEEITLSNLPAPFEKVKAHFLFPPSFDYNVRRKYPVIILFGSGEGLQVSPLLETMYVREASIEEAFVINIHSFDSAPFCAFNPYSKANTGTVNSIWKCKDEEQCKMFNFCWFSKCNRELFEDGTRTYLHAMQCGGSGEVILDIIEQHVIPRAETKAPNRLLLDFPRNRLTVIGFDGAGLLACHAAISRPYVYQNAACMSAPFHWPMNVLLQGSNITPTEQTGISKTMSNSSHEFLYYPEKRALYSTQKYYIDYGNGDNHHFPIVEASHYMEWFIEKLKVEFGVLPERILYFKKLLKSSNNYFVHTDGGTEILNRIRMPLLFFLRAKGGPNAVFPQLALPIPGLDPDDKVMNEEEEKEMIPEECLLQFQIFQRRSDNKSGVPIAALLVCIGIYVAVSVLVTVLFMCIRENVGKTTADNKKGSEEKELLEHMDSDTSSDSDLSH